jgi:dolichol-phosphate mannosyltransferase
MKKSITIFVPAYNEEKNLASAVKRYDKIVRSITPDYEILIVDDGSVDRTGAIADALARANKKIRVVHHKKNMNLGYGYREAVKLARKNYFVYLTGEGETKDKSIKSLLSQMGKADMIIAYIGNPQVRPWFRRIISGSFTLLLNLFFGLRLKYYQGQAIHKTSNLKKIKLTTNSFAFQAETAIRLLKSRKKYSYIQVPYDTVRTTGSTLFRPKNLIGVFTAVLRLFYDIYIKKN